MSAGTGALLPLAGSFPASEEQLAIANQLHKALTRLLRRARADGGLRPEITASDIYLLLADIRVEHPTDPNLTPKLRQRHFALLLDGMRSGPHDPLPGPPATWIAIRTRWSGQAEPAR